MTALLASFVTEVWDRNTKLNAGCDRRTHFRRGRGERGAANSEGDCDGTNAQLREHGHAGVKIVAGQQLGLAIAAAGLVAGGSRPED